MDNLTVDWLRFKLNDLEQNIKECQTKQVSIAKGDDVNGGSPRTNGLINGTAAKDQSK